MIVNLITIIILILNVTSSKHAQLSPSLENNRGDCFKSQIVCEWMWNTSKHTHTHTQL